MKWGEGMFREIGELLYPWPLACVHCGEPNDGEDALCPECRLRLGAQPATCGFTGDEFGISAAAHIYYGPAGALVRALKYRTLSILAKEMARDMIQAAKIAGIPRPDVVTYVPMHWRRRQGRYINQAQLLAERVARLSAKPCIDVLQRIRHTHVQARLPHEMRLENVSGAFSLCDHAGIQGLHILLVDDVITTGATISECKALLEEAGAAVTCAAFAVAGKSLQFVGNKV